MEEDSYRWGIKGKDAFDNGETISGQGEIMRLQGERRDRRAIDEFKIELLVCIYMVK